MTSQVLTIEQQWSPTAGVPEEVAELGPWFHNLHLPGGLYTAPSHPLGDFPNCKWLQIAPHIPQDLTGWTALDIGCNAGFYTFELARRGARVTGLDTNPHYLRQAHWAAPRLGLTDQVRFVEGQIYDLNRSVEQYDLVLFLGVFYHLRYPMLGLDIVSRLVKRLIVFQTLTIPGTEVEENVVDRPLNDRDALAQPAWPKMAFVEHSFAGDPTNWWLANHACVEAMLRSAGFKIIGYPGHEIYLAQPDPDNPSCVSSWNQGEYLSATGQCVLAEASRPAG